MMFDKKYFINGVERNDLVNVTSEEEVISVMREAFDNDTDIAIYEEMRMADGRFAVTLKDRKRKIIVQYKESKNGNTGNAN